LNGVGFSVKPVLEGIEAASRAGLPVKINMVVKKGFNEGDILPLARYFKEKGHSLRFIEFMDVGNTNGWKLDQVVPSKEIMEMIHAEMPLEPVQAGYYGEVAKRCRYVGTDVEIGFISSVTHAFCGTCTRERLSAEGRLFTCLFASKSFDLRTPLREGATDAELTGMISRVWENREDRYSEERLSQTSGLKGKKSEMSYLGG
jgi:cyclic pyranopterin phosphate synthase